MARIYQHQHSEFLVFFACRNEEVTALRQRMSEWLEEMKVCVYLCMCHMCKKRGGCGADV